MKKVLLSVVAAAAAATALPALAQPYGAAHGYHRNQGYDDRGWSPISQRADRLNERIERGVRNGQITRREANRLRAQLIRLVRLEANFRQGGLNGWERQELDRRFDMLRAEIRFERRDDDRRWDGRGDRDWDDDDRRGRRGRDD